jgi:hypothetical protein
MGQERARFLDEACASDQTLRREVESLLAGKIVSDLLAHSEKKYVSAYDIAVVYSGLDNRENTFKWLDRAYAERAGFLTFVRSDPRFKPLRHDPPFQDLLRRMQFPKTQA